MKKKKKLKDVSTYFLACELKPKSPLWSVLDPFAYDIQPAFIHGSLGILSYQPEAYAILDTGNESPPLLGYICTITHPETRLLLDKLKGFNGVQSFNTHDKKIVSAYTDLENAQDAWCYIVTDAVLDAYRQVEQVEFGITDRDEDTELLALLSRIEEDL